jgi:hypothetical protein
VRPTVPLQAGVFDYGESLNPADNHDLIGRVSIDLTNLQKDTLYTLKYAIFDTARMTQRQGRGFIHRGRKSGGTISKL